MLARLPYAATTTRKQQQQQQQQQQQLQQLQQLQQQHNRGPPTEMALTRTQFIVACHSPSPLLEMHRTSSATSSPTKPLPYPEISPHALPTAQCRYVAGDAFFNYARFGSLRTGADPVEVWDRRYIGLAVQFAVCGFAFNFSNYGYGRILANYLSAGNQRHIKATTYMLSWPQCFAVFIGLLSDCKPLLGYRRKSYMVLGALLSATTFLALTFLDWFASSTDSLQSSDDSLPRKEPSTVYSIAFLLLSLVASLGIQISWVSALALSVELAQREQLRLRGYLQGILVVLYCFGGVVADLMTFQMVNATESDSDQGQRRLTSTLSVGEAAAVLAGVIALAIPFAVCFVAEAPILRADQSKLSVKRHATDFWRFCSENLVYRVMFFIMGVVFFLAFYNPNARDAIAVWSHVSIPKSLLVEVMRRVGKMLGALVWTLFLSNVSWKYLGIGGAVIYTTCNGVLGALAPYDVVRSEWFYGACLSGAELVRAMSLIYGVILPTEIANTGREGVVTGMGMSFQMLSTLASFTISEWLPDIVGLQVTVSDVLQDLSATRQRVFIASAICVGVNLVSFVFIPLIPHQKLDAQQLRAFGGYNRFARIALCVVFVVLLVFNLVANLLVVI